MFHLFCQWCQYDLFNYQVCSSTFLFYLSKAMIHFWLDELPAFFLQSADLTLLAADWFVMTSPEWVNGVLSAPSLTCVSSGQVCVPHELTITAELHSCPSVFRGFVFIHTTKEWGRSSVRHDMNLCSVNVSKFSSREAGIQRITTYWFQFNFLLWILSLFDWWFYSFICFQNLRLILTLKW